MYTRSQGLLRPQNAGTLRGLQGHNQGLGVAVIPFTLGGAPGLVRGGARVIGRIGQQVIALLHLRTGDRPDSGSGERFTVARVSRNLFRVSSVGLLL